ncbi:MAG: hypothetical protein H8D23_23580 [Candidatus Brocadiales bacterium]|nr:hypothetical protein [Candidatus Brocadiales bacterium]
MVKLKNPRAVRLMDYSGRFDLKPGEEVEFESVPKDLVGLIKKGYLVKVQVKANVQTETTETKSTGKKDLKPSAKKTVPNPAAKSK